MNYKKFLSGWIFFVFLASFIPIHASALQIGDRVQTTVNLSVRSCAFLRCDFTDPARPTASALSTGTILKGPYSADGYTWWYISWDNSLTGYSVENYFSFVVTTSEVPPAITFGMPIGGDPDNNENLSGDLNLLNIGAYSNEYPKIRFNFNDNGDTSGDNNEWYVSTAFNQNQWIKNIWAIDGDLDWYCPGDNCSSTNYAFHPGEDWNLTKGFDSDLSRPIYAIADGIVLYNGCAYGNTIIIAHKRSSGEIVTSFYGHME